MRSFKSLVKNKLQKELDGEAGKEKERKDEFLSPEAGPLILLVARDGSVASLLCKSKASERSAAQKVLGSWRVEARKELSPSSWAQRKAPAGPGHARGRLVGLGLEGRRVWSSPAAG